MTEGPVMATVPAARRQALRDAIARTAGEVREHERQRAAAAREIRRLEAKLKALDASARDHSRELPAPKVGFRRPQRKRWPYSGRCSAAAPGLRHSGPSG